MPARNYKAQFDFCIQNKLCLDIYIEYQHNLASKFTRYNKTLLSKCTAEFHPEGHANLVVIQ